MKNLLKTVETYVHPLNKYLLQPKSLKHVKLLDRPSVKLLTFNMCLVPYVLGPVVEAPYQEQRMVEFVRHHLQDYDVICL